MFQHIITHSWTLVSVYQQHRLNSDKFRHNLQNGFFLTLTMQNKPRWGLAAAFLQLSTVRAETHTCMDVFWTFHVRRRPSCFQLDSFCCCTAQEKGRKNRLLPSNRYHRYYQGSLLKSTLLCTLKKRQRMEEVEGSAEEFIKDNIKKGGERKDKDMGLRGSRGGGKKVTFSWFII